MAARLSPVLLSLLFTAAAPAAPPRAEQPKPAHTDRYGDPLPDGAIARLGTIRFRHPFWVTGLAFMPDGKTLISTCWSGSVHFWDAATGKETRSFRIPEKTKPGRGPTAILGLALSPDGKKIMAVTNHEFAYLWDRESGKELHCLKGGNGFGLALSADGKTLAISQSGGKGRFVLWDTATGQEVRAFGTDLQPSHALAFSPDGRLLASGNVGPFGPIQKKEDGASPVRLWDTATGRPLRELKGHTGGIAVVAFAPDGRTLVSGSYDATLRFWEPSSGKLIRKIAVPDDTPSEDELDRRRGINYGGVVTLAYSPDGRLLASGGYDGTVRLWDAASGKELHVLRGHGREVVRIAFSPDGKRLATGSRDQTIRLWDVRSGKQLQARQGADGPVNNLAISPDGRTVAAVCQDRSIRLWSLPDGQQRHILRGHGNFIYDVAFAPDGRTFASSSADRTVRLWDAATGREQRPPLKHPGAVYSVAFASDRNTLLSGERNGTLHFWDAVEEKNLRLIPGVYSGHFLQTSANGAIVATAARNAVLLLDGKTGKELKRFGGSWLRFALSPDGRMVAMQLSGERKIRLRITDTGEEYGTLADSQPTPGFVGVVTCAFSPDGRLLACVADSDNLEVWEVLTGKLRRRFRGHLSGVGPFVFSPDGKTLLSGSNDTTILVWDVARQHEERPERLDVEALRDCWRDLGGADAAKADRAIGVLSAAAEQSLLFLEKNLRPAKVEDEGQVRRWIAELDSEQFAVRERAARELERLGAQAEAALRQTLKKSPTLEARRRIERLLAPLGGMLSPGELLRSLRGVEVLERIGTAEARKLLQSLADGAAEARLTREAKTALERLKKRREAPESAGKR